MECGRCGNNVKEGWAYCPKCGNPLRSRDLFSDMFERMRREMKEMDRVFEKDMQFFDLSPFFRQQKPRGSGFTIRITRSGNSEPKVSVRTFGNVDRSMKREISEELGELGGSWGERRRPEQKESLLRRMIPAGRPAEVHREAPGKEDLDRICEPRSTEEPECSVRPLEDRVVVEIKLPGVKSERDIRVKELESSVEVKAMVKDKAYFKILTKPGNRRIAGKSFGKGVLRIELR